MTYPVARRDLVNLALILIIAAALRFNNLSVSEFAGDEAALSSSAQHIAAGQSLPLFGMMSSASIPNFATGDYLMTIPFALSHSPLFAVGVIALLNVVGVELFWLLVHRYLDPHIAVLAALAYAVSPWALLYSRKIWAPDFVAPFVILGLLLGLYGFVEGKRWAQLLSIPVFILALQINFAAWALLPVIIWLIWIGRRRIFWPALIVAVLIAALTIIPFVAGILPAQTIQQVLSRRTSLLQADHTLPLTHTFWLITGRGLDTWHNIPPQDLLAGQLPILSIFWLLLLPALVYGLAMLWRRSRPFAIFVALWASLPTVALIFSKQSQVHYYASSIPAYCILIGAGVVSLAFSPRVTTILRAIVLSGFGLILFTQVANWRSFLSFVEVNYVPNGFNTPIHDYLDIASHLKPDVIIFPTPKTDNGYHIWSPLLFGQAACVREAVIAEGGIAVLPQGEFSLLRSPNSPSGDLDILYQYPSTEQITFPLRAGEGAYTLEQVVQPATWIGPALTAIPPVRFDNGVALKGYAIADQRLYLDWTLPAASSNDYQVFVHLLKPNGDKAAQHDSSFYSGKYWCANDRIITWITLDRPSDAVTLRVGMYRLANGQIIGSSTVDSSESVLAPWVDIPLGTA